MSWKSVCMDAWIGGWLDGQTNGWMDEWIIVCMLD